MLNVSGIRTSSEGRLYLGAAIDSESYVMSFVANSWSDKVTELSRFAAPCCLYLWFV